MGATFKPLLPYGEGKPVADAGHIGSRLAHYASNQGIRRPTVRLDIGRDACPVTLMLALALAREGGWSPLPNLKRFDHGNTLVDFKIAVSIPA